MAEPPSAGRRARPVPAAGAKVVDRIRKLLALSQSSNEHEAAAAAARAAELMAEHHIHAAMLADSESEPVDEHCIETAGRAVSWKGILAAGIAYSFGCAMFWRSGRHEGSARCRTMIVGRPGDVDAVRYTYAYLCSEVERLADAAWRAHLPEVEVHQRARRWKNGFRVGAAQTIARRLRESRDASFARRQRDADPATAQALVRIARDRAEVDEFVTRLRLRTGSRPVVTSSSGLGAGIAAGRCVELGRDHVRLGRPAPRLKGD